MMRKIGYLEKLSKEEHPSIFKIIRSNVDYITICVLEGLQCLQNANMQHCDIKGKHMRDSYFMGQFDPCPNWMLF